MNDVIEQLMTILEFHSENNYDTLDHWIDVHIHCIKIFTPLMTQFLETKKDQKISRMDIFSRFTKYISKIVAIFSDIIGNPHTVHPELKVYRKTIYAILSCYLEIVAHIPSEWVYGFFKEHIHGLVPTQPEHAMLSIFFCGFITKVKNISAYLIAFLEFMTTRMEKTPTTLIEHLRKTITDTYTNPAILSNTSPDDIKKISNSLYKLFLTALCANNTRTIELIFIVLFRIAYKTPAGKESNLSQFIANVKNTGIDWSIFLREMRPEIVYSRLALSMFPILDIKTNYDAWYELFLPVLEENDEKMNDLYAFYTAIQHNLDASFAETKQVTKIKVINALTRQMSSSNRQKIDIVRRILQQISDYISQLAIETKIEKPLPKVVVIENEETHEKQPLVIDVFYNAYKSSGKEDVDFLFYVFKQCMDQMYYTEILIDSTVDDIAREIKSKKPEILRDYFSQLQETVKQKEREMKEQESDQSQASADPANLQTLEVSPEQLRQLVKRSERIPGNISLRSMKYKCIYFIYVLFNEIVLINDDSDGVYDFLTNVNFLFYYHDRVKAILELTDKLISQVPFGKKWLSLVIPVLASSLQEHRYGYSIIKRHVLSHPFETKENYEFLQGLYIQCMNLSNQQSYHVQKVVKPLLREIDGMPFIKEYMMKKRVEMMEKYLGLLNFPQVHLKYRFIFSRPFTEYPRQQEIFDATRAAIQKEQFTPDKMYCSQKYQKKILHMISMGSTMHSSVLQLKRLRHFFKTLAYALIALQQDSPQYILSFQFFNDSKYRSFLPYFLSCLQKGVQLGMGSFKGLPKDPMYLVRLPQKVTAIPRKLELRIMLFAVESERYLPQYRVFLNYIVSACDFLVKKYDPTKRDKYLFIFDTFYKVMNNFAKHKKEIQIPIRVLQSLVDCAIAFKSLRTPITLPIKKCVPGLEEEFLSLFVQYLTRDMQTQEKLVLTALNIERIDNILTLWEKLFTTTTLTTFASLCVEKLYSNLVQIIQFYSNQVQFIGKLCFCLFSAFATVIKKGILPSQIVDGMIKITIKIFQRVFKDYKLFKPSNFSNIVNIILPQKIDNYLEKEHLIKCIVNESIPFVLSKPCIFNHPICVKRITATLLKINRKQQKEAVTKYVEQIRDKPIDVQAFYKLLLYNYFTEYVKKYKSENENTENPDDFDEIVIDVTDFPDEQFLPLRFTNEYLTIKLCEIPFVTIEDALSKTEIWRINSSSHQVFLSRGIIGSDTILTYSRLTRLILFKENQTEDLISKYTDYLYLYPYTTSFLLIRMLSVNHDRISVRDNAKWQHLVICVCLKFIGSGEKIVSTALSSFPQYIKQIIGDFDESFYPSLFNFFINFCTLFLKNGKEQLQLLIPIPPLFTKLSEKVTHDDINWQQMNKLKELLNNVPQGDMQSEVAPVLKLQFCLIPALAKYLFSKDVTCHYFPQALLPHFFLSNKQIFNYYIDFKAVLEMTYKYANPQTMKRIIDDIEQYLIKQPNIKLSPQSNTPFTTLYKWATEILIDTPVLKPLDAFIEALRPYNRYTMVNDLRHICYPSSKNLYKLLNTFITADVNKYEDLRAFHVCDAHTKAAPPSVDESSGQPILFNGSDRSNESNGDYVSELWNNRWEVQPLSQHIFVFAKIYLRRELRSYINYMSADDLHELLCVSLSENVHRLNRFVRFYTSLFKEGALCDVFYASELFTMELPKPQQSVFANMKYLQDITMYDDSLGVMALHSKSLQKAACYHQLCQYDAARAFYMSAMESDRSTYAMALYQLRSVTMNLDFTNLDITRPLYTIIPDTKSYSLDVPIVRLYTKDGETTEKAQVSREVDVPKTYFLIPTLTSVQRLIIFDEIIATLRSVTVDPSIAFRKWSHSHDVLDKNTFYISELGFNVHQVKFYKQFIEQNKSFASYSHSFVSLLLLRTNSIRQSIKSFLKSIELIDYTIPQPIPRQQIVQQAANVANVANVANAANVAQAANAQTNATSLLSNLLPHAAKLASQANIQQSRAAQNLIQQVVQQKQKQHLQQLQQTALQNQMQRQEKTDNRYSLSLMHWTVPRIYRMFQKISKEQSELPSVVKTRLSYLLEVRDFESFLKLCQSQKVHQISFFKFYSLMFVNFPREFCTPVLFKNLATQFTTATQANLEQFNTFLALAFAAVRKAPQNTEVFMQTLLPQTIDYTLARAWLFWLPHFFAIFEHPPMDFLKKLISFYPCHVRAIMRNIVAAHTAKSEKFLIDDLKNYIMKTPDWAKMREYDNMFLWLKDIEQDIINYKNSVFVHSKVAEELATGKDFSPEVKQIAGDSIDEIIDYVTKNPPFFKTDKRTINPQMNYGLKFPPLNNTTCYNLQVLADGSKEGIFQFTTNKGVKLNYTVVCSDLFPLNYSAEIFINLVWNLFHTHPSVKMHSNFLDRTTSLYYLHNSLVLMTSDYRSLQQVTRVPIVAKLLARKKELSEQRRGENTPQDLEIRSPYEIRERKLIEYDTNTLTEWVLKNSAGNKVDFLCMRDAIVSHISCISAIKFLFSSGYCIYPNIMFNKDRRKVFMPGITRSSKRVVHLPLTNTIKGFIPEYVLKGTFSTIWHIVFDSIQSNSEKFAIFYNALIDSGDKNTNNIIKRATMLATMENIDSDKEDEPFPIMLIDHLINTSTNVFCSQEMGFAWI